MPTKEIELKLLIAEKDIEAFLEHRLLSDASKRPLHHCYSTYYDTPDHLLMQRGYALRLREDNGQFIQTLKGKNLDSSSGMHERQEWEWEVPNDQLDLNLLPEEIQDFVKSLDLTPVFVTDFMRQCWDFTNNDQHIEIALDRGEIRFGNLVEPVCEVELEIKSGDKSGLMSMAEMFKQTIHLKPFDVSKAERGYRLHLLSQANHSS